MRFRGPASKKPRTVRPLSIRVTSILIHENPFDPWPILLTYALPHPLLGLSGDSQVRLNGLKAGKLLLRFLV